MRTLEETTQLYATVLREILPIGGYINSPNTVIASDVYAHAKALAEADLSAERLLNAVESIPLELLEQYESELGLPLKCRKTDINNIEERLKIVSFVKNTRNVLNKAYLISLLSIFGLELIDLIKFKPIQCTTSCTASTNTQQLRYKVLCKLKAPTDANLACISLHYLPAYLRIDIEYSNAKN